ncbi:hypothetical protein [Aquitalea sp. LB_tupeE]|nr:hypothetical protein [Aquitalea sp. LB_tupeE]NWK80114.1 hypothetical protein [Aquitalea sp. LB_tupeE]
MHRASAMRLIYDINYPSLRTVRLAAAFSLNYEQEWMLLILIAISFKQQ